MPREVTIELLDDSRTRMSELAGVPARRATTHSLPFRCVGGQGEHSQHAGVGEENIERVS